MNLFRWIGSLFSGGGSSGNRNLPIYVLSRRCNEPIAGQVDIYNELSRDEEETGYYVRKVLHTSGESRCFDQVEVNIWFDSRKNMTEHEVIGGRWLTEAEYEQELVRFKTPPDADDDITPALQENGQAVATTPDAAASGNVNKTDAADTPGEGRGAS